MIGINLAAFLKALAEQRSLEAERAADVLTLAAVALIGARPE